MPQPSDVDARVDALYAGPLDEFVAARDALAKEVAAGGDRVGSARAKRLRRPTVAAWAVNQVARSRPDDVAALATLGDELRAATADRDRGRIKALDHLRRERTEALVGSLRADGVAGRELSASVLDRVAETLTAVVMDEDAAAVVRAGRLEQALQHVGFGVVDEGGEEADVVALRAASGPAAQAAPRTGAAASADATADAAADADADGSGDALAAAEREVAATSAEVEQLEGRRQDALAAVRRAQDDVEERGVALRRLEAEVARLTKERDEADRALEAARAEVASLDEALDEAEERASKARRARRAAQHR